MIRLIIMIIIMMIVNTIVITVRSAGVGMRVHVLLLRSSNAALLICLRCRHEGTHPP